MSYAVIFKAHFWDESVEKQFYQLKKNCPSADIFIVFDVDSGNQNQIPYGNNIIFVGARDLYDAGLDNSGGFWANGDYQTILFWLKKPSYDFYVSVEHDVGVFCSIDNIIDDMRKNNIDSVYGDLELERGAASWPHLGTTIDYYNFIDINPKLFCISFFSKAAVSAIYTRRLLQMKLKKSSNNSNFPLGEAVMGSEPALSGLKEKNLLRYCDNLDNYHWNQGVPYKYVEQFVNGNTFVHPVTSNNKVISSNTTDDITKIDSKLLLKAAMVAETEFFINLLSLPNNSYQDKQELIKLAKETLSENENNKFFFHRTITEGFVSCQSSISAYSRHNSEHADVVSSIPKGKFSNHTNEEENPFFRINFSEKKFVSKAYIYDRPDISRYYTYEISSGSEGEKEILYKSEYNEKLGDIYIGPKIININKEIDFLNISIVGYGIIHLDSIILFD